MARIIEVDYPPLMLDQAVALRAYAQGHGRSWKIRLCVEWMNATADPLLHHLRNSHGPMWLDRLVLDAEVTQAGTPFASWPATPGS
ncbi:MAG: hypothetical protein ACRYG8_22685 [Janthinobacterium lividum]